MSDGGMNTESGPGKNLPTGDIKPSRKFDRLGFLARVAVEAMVKRPHLEGLEHLKEIPADKRVIFATSHLSDIDEVAAIEALAPYRKLDVASLATNQKDPKQAIPEYIAGRGRFHDVRNRFDVENDMPYENFDSKNFDEMKKAMDKGSDMVISAHNPTRKWDRAQLPDKEGIGAAYLAQISRSPVFPVALDIHSEARIGMASDIGGTLGKNRKGRSEATLRIGAPIFLEQISEQDLDSFTRLTSSKSRKELRDQGQFESAKEAYLRVRKTISSQGGQIMEAVAGLLPSGKGGSWAK